MFQKNLDFDFELFEPASLLQHNVLFKEVLTFSKNLSDVKFDLTIYLEFVYKQVDQFLYFEIGLLHCPSDAFAAELQ